MEAYVSFIPGGAGVVLSGNSSTSALNAAATYTGTFIDVSPFASVVVAVKTDQAGSLFIDFSPDGTNVDSTLTFTVAAATNEVHRVTVTRKYFRVRFTNTSASNQTYMRLQSMAGSYQALTSALNAVVQSDQDTLVVRPLDFNLMTAEGLYQNHANTIKDGIKLDIDAGSGLADDISNELPAGSSYTGFPASPVASEIVVAGADTGTVYYSYMGTDTDTDYTIAAKAVTGAGTYSLGHNIWRCNFAYFVKNSTTALNAGNITVQATGGANVFCRIDAGYGQTFCAAYTVPYQTSIYLDRLNGNMRGSSTGAMDSFFWYRPYGESPRLRFPFELQYGSLFFDDIDYLNKIPARADLIPRVVYCSANNLAAKFSYRFIKVKEA